LSTELQERIIGRTKLSDVELDDSIKPTSAHNALTTITEKGNEFQIVRDNMPFGQVGTGEFGTYFIGYCRTPRVTEQMIENMFVGRPPGNYDRLLDFSRAMSGSVCFVPSATFLESVNDDAPAATAAGSTLKRAPSKAPAIELKRDPQLDQRLDLALSRKDALARRRDRLEVPARGRQPRGVRRRGSA
jgi:porphyrinogen peroxidase